MAFVISFDYIIQKQSKNSVAWDVTIILTVNDSFFSVLSFSTSLFSRSLLTSFPLFYSLQLGLPTSLAVEEPSSPTHGLPMTGLVHGQTDWL